MQPFRSPDHMLDVHDAMFGTVGRRFAELVLKHAATLFAAPIDPLNVRILLAPVELSPYNRHAGYVHNAPADQGSFILANRQLVTFRNGAFVLDESFYLSLEDFIVHELTHTRQAQLLRQHPNDKAWLPKRTGHHQDRGWYTAVAEAAPKYIGVDVPPTSWPNGSRPRKLRPNLTEPEMTYWPVSLRRLAKANDPRLPKAIAG
jgi:hypothetical protein